MIVYNIAALAMLVAFQTTLLTVRIDISLTTFRLLLTIPFLIMLWIMVVLIKEPKYHKIKVVLEVYLSLATFFLIGALIFNN